MIICMTVETSKRQKSRDYPAISLKKAVEFARRIYEKDRWAEAPALSTVKHMGYAGLNGGSRPALSALRKYGLVEYLGSGDNLRVKLTDLAKRIFVPLNDTEKAGAVWEALNSPQVHGDLLTAFPAWELPSDDTLAARLEREFRMQHAAVRPFIADLRESLEYAKQFGHPNVEPREGEYSGDGSGAGFGDGTGSGAGNGSGAGFGDGTGSGAGGGASEKVPRGLLKLPMPGSSTFIVLPETMDAADAKRTLAWLKRVVTPAIEFASGADEDDEAE